MNFWTPTWDDWGQGRNDSTMPWYAKYDWVEVYDYNQGSDSFTLRWRDDFNSLDTATRWTVSDGWSFDQNSSTFMATHTYVKNGLLILDMNKRLNRRKLEGDEDEEELDQ